MASAADLRDILSLPQHSGTPVASGSGKPKVGTTRKPEGISRELYSLIGDSAPTLVAQYARPKFKQKPDFGKGRVKWWVIGCSA
jgi:DNA methyltransferase 1-associated protein 1